MNILQKNYDISLICILLLINIIKVINNYLVKNLLFLLKLFNNFLTNQHFGVLNNFYPRLLTDINRVINNKNRVYYFDS